MSPVFFLLSKLGSRLPLTPVDVSRPSSLRLCTHCCSRFRVFTVISTHTRLSPSGHIDLGSLLLFYSLHKHPYTQHTLSFPNLLPDTITKTQRKSFITSWVELSLLLKDIVLVIFWRLKIRWNLHFDPKIVKVQLSKICLPINQLDIES